MNVNIKIDCPVNILHSDPDLKNKHISDIQSLESSEARGQVIGMFDVSGKRQKDVGKDLDVGFREA